MKTAKEWFEQLPEPIRTQAKDAWEKSEREEKNGLFASLSHSLDGSFWYDETPQGDKHWEDICYRAEAGEFDQPTPNLHGWIPVSERLPEEIEAEYLVIDRNQNIKVSYFDGNVWGYLASVKENVLFWQPLPKLPEVRNG